MKKLSKAIVGERPSRRKRRLRALSNSVKRQERALWCGWHQNNNTHTRPTPSLAPIHMPVVEW